MSKKIIILTLVLALLASLQINTFAAAGTQPSLSLDGKTLDTAGEVRDGALYLPLRAIAENLGYNVTWTRKGNTVTLTKDGNDIMIGLDDRMITKEGHAYYLDGEYSGNVQSSIIFVNEKTYLYYEGYPGLLGLKAESDNSKEMVSLEKVQFNAIKIKNVKKAYEEKYLKLTIQYPEISGLESKTAQDAINSTLKKDADNAEAEGVKNAADMKQSYDSGYPGSPNKCETYYDYHIKYNQNGLFSVVLQDYQYTGGAHGSTVQSSRTFDLKSGKEYRLADLFKDGTDYVKAVSTDVKLQMDERVKAGLLPLPFTTFEAIRKDQDYYLSDRGISVYFQQYEYYPYAAGIQEFEVPYGKLKDLLKSEFGAWQSIST